MSRMRSRRRTGAPSFEVNVTSLVDVAFVLLLVFIIVAPNLQSGVEVNLPSAQTRAVEATPETLTITIRNDGQVYLNQETSPSEHWLAALQKQASAPQDTPVFVRADEGANYGTVLQILASLSQAGFTNVSLLSDTPTSP